MRMSATPNHSSIASAMSCLPELPYATRVSTRPFLPLLPLAHCNGRGVLLRRRWPPPSSETLHPSFRSLVLKHADFTLSYTLSYTL